MENNSYFFKFSSDVLDAYATAAAISCSLNEDAISSFDFLMSALTYSENGLYDSLYDLGIVIDAEEAVIRVSLDKKLYEKITKKVYDDYLNHRVELGKKYEIVAKAKNTDKSIEISTFGANTNIFEECSEELITAMALAYNNCLAKNQDYVDVDNIIYAILQDKTSTAYEFLDELLGKEIVVKLTALMRNVVQSSNIKRIGSDAETSNSTEIDSSITCLNDKYKKGDTCDILGRDNEIFKVWNIISKKTKRNAVLIGEPGVGKSAIIEAMTYSIVNKTCPKGFENYKVYELNLNGMVAGTKYRGEFEEKVEKLIKFLESRKDIIVFVDEIHQILGTGHAEGSGPDLSGALKPLLARDDVVFIGATTIDEYERIFSRDGAFSRRFEVVPVMEPRFDKVKAMIESRVKTLSNYHKVTISDKVLDKVLIYATSFSDVANPDRTIDLVDKSMAVAKMQGAKEVQEKHIRLVYKDYFDAFKKIPYKSKLSTAYHEAGHFVLWYTSKSKLNEDCMLISIIPVPDKGWLGVNRFERVDVSKYKPVNYSYIKEEVAVSVAGRIAQSLVSKELDSGASSDLNQATAIVEEYLLHYGLDDSYKNYSFTSRNDSLKISDKVSDDIREKTKAIINEVYSQTEKTVKKYSKSIEYIAKALVKNGMITKQEAIEAFNQGKEESRSIKNKVTSNNTKKEDKVI